jgi:hypothetical protein
MGECTGKQAWPWGGERGGRERERERERERGGGGREGGSLRWKGRKAMGARAGLSFGLTSTLAVLKIFKWGLGIQILLQNQRFFQNLFATGVLPSPDILVEIMLLTLLLYSTSQWNQGIMDMHFFTKSLHMLTYLLSCKYDRYL